MSELDDAIARLEQAVVRLEAASGRVRPSAVADERLAEAAAGVAARLDAALAKLGALLDRED